MATGTRQWNGMGMKNPFPHISTIVSLNARDARYQEIPDGSTPSQKYCDYRPGTKGGFCSFQCVVPSHNDRR